MKLRVNIGCGRTPTEGWFNFDNSPAIKFANSPIKYKIAQLFWLLDVGQIENIEWNIKNKIGFADATKLIPLKDNSAECIYSCHMVDHLSREGVLVFLSEALRVLEIGGVLRVAVPDLRIAINEYLDSEDADNFMDGILVQAPAIKTIRQKLKLLVAGYRHHQWMYDGKSLCKLFESCGFKEVQVFDNGNTKIVNPQGLNLFERCEQSVYVEGKK
jgi:predicted SAM-dependent methyltransferase